VISETLRGNKLNGILIAIVPLITDAPIILVSVFILKVLPSTQLILGILSLFGGAFLTYLGIQNLNFSPIVSNSSTNYRSTIKNGIVANFLSPHPYLFWISIGAPTCIRASESSTLNPIAFIAGFYLLLIGSKVVVAIVSSKVKNFIKSNLYVYLMKFLGLILLILAVLMFYDGFQLIRDYIV